MSGQTTINNISSEYQVTRDSTGTIVNQTINAVGASSEAFLGTLTLDDATTNVHWQVLDNSVYMRLDGGTVTSVDMTIGATIGGTWSRSFAETATVLQNSGAARIVITELQKASSDRPA
jgi:hypothetical protein